MTDIWELPDKEGEAISHKFYTSALIFKGGVIVSP